MLEVKMNGLRLTLNCGVLIIKYGGRQATFKTGKATMRDAIAEVVQWAKVGTFYSSWEDYKFGNRGRAAVRKDWDRYDRTYKALKRIGVAWESLRKLEVAL